MSGPAPTPTALKRLRGNPGRRPLPENEPEPPRDVPVPPADLSDEAAQEWARVVPALVALGLVTVVDRAYLVGYVEAWAAFNAARLSLAEHGPLVAGRDGGLVRNPAAQIMRDSADLMIKFGSRFGLSPSDRARLSIAPKEDEGPGADVLSLLS